MIIRASSIAFVLVLCTGCAKNDYIPLSYLALHWYVENFDPVSQQGHRTLDWASNIHRQCAASTSGADCSGLNFCMRKVGRTIFYDPSSPEKLVITNRTYNRIVPSVDVNVNPVPVYSMSFLRERAEKAGPRAVALFAEMEEARNVCLAETGLTERIGYN